MDIDSVALEAAAFRPAKRRRYTRNRRPSAGAESDSKRPDTVSSDNEEETLNAPVSEILRIRQKKMRKNGVEFSNTRTRSVEPPPSAPAAVNTDAERIKAISDRFVAHSGHVIDIDRHMIAYIESEMAKRRLGQTSPESSDPTTSDAQYLNDEEPRPSSGLRTVQRQPAAVGKIHEIDLGKDAALRNRERTEIAVRRARGEQIPADGPETTRKPRLGRNGKPRRGPKRRNSEDLKRDQIVEQVLHESRLEIYDGPETEHQDDKVEADDDRIAEQFRRDFIEAMQARHRHRNSQSKHQSHKAGDHPPRGPKLGGSRSARAAMRERQEKAAKK